MTRDHMTISLRNAPEEKPEMSPPPRTYRRRRLVVVILALFAAAAVFFGCYAVYSHFTNVSAGTGAPNTQQIVGQVGKLMLLPTDEVPTIAVVSDVDKLKGQQFFANARQGDVVLMYARAARAILYDPQLNKIIEVAPITAGQP